MSTQNRSRAIAATGLLAAGWLFVLVGCQSVGSDRGFSLDGMQKVEVQANTFTPSAQANASLDVFPGGNVVTVWDSRRQQGGGYGIYARLLNAAGEVLTPEVEVNQFTYGHQTDPSVSVGSDGTIWITWTSTGQDGSAGAVVVRRFDRELRPIGDEQVANAKIAGHQADPVVEVNTSGQAMVVWTTQTGQTTGARLAGRLFLADGSPAGDEWSIGSVHGGTDSIPTLAAGPGGGFVLVWARVVEELAGGTPYRILAQRFTSAGESVGEEFGVSPADGQMHIEPSVDVDGAGRIIVGWLAQERGDYQIATRRFEPDGSPLGKMELLTKAESSWLSGVAIAAADDGHYVVGYNHDVGADGDQLGIVGQVFGADGEAVGDEIVLNLHTIGHQSLQMASNARRIAWGANGQLAIAWVGDAGLGDESAANVTMFLGSSVSIESPDPTRLAAVNLATDAVAPIPPTFDPNWEPLPPPRNLRGGGPDFGFMGINFTGWAPPDPELAVGPDHVVAMTNGAIAFFSKTGTLLFEDEIEDSFGFWGGQGATSFVFDPECIYDPHSGRFFAMACERASNGRSYYLLAVSDDSNPVGTWHKYRILTTVDNDIDSPNMGVDENVLYLTADFFGGDKYGIVMIDKSSILSGGAVVSTTHTITGSGNQSMGIPIHYSTGNAAGYIIQSSEGTGNGITFGEVRFHGMRDQLGSPTRVSVDVNVPTYSYPTQPTQRGTSNRPFLFEPRFWSCFYTAGSLWAVHHIGSPARARWYEFDMNGWPNSGSNPTLVQSGEIAPGSGIHTYFPSIAADGEGNACIIFSRSSSSEYISIGRAFRRHNDPLGTFRPMEFVKQSTRPYTAVNRWGDYSHIEPNPGMNGVFWGIAEWTDVSSSWRTWITEVDTRPQQQQAVLSDVTRTLGIYVSGGVAEASVSDDTYYVVRSGPGFNPREPHPARVDFGFDTLGLPATTLDVTFEEKANIGGPTAVLLLRDFVNSEWDELERYAMSPADQTFTFTGVPAGDYISGLNRIEVRLRTFAVLVLNRSVRGLFSHDFVGIGLNE